MTIRSSPHSTPIAPQLTLPSRLIVVTTVSTIISGPPANVAPEIPGADHRQAASSTLEIPEGFLRVCVLACRRRHPGPSSTTSTGDPLQRLQVARGLPV